MWYEIMYTAYSYLMNFNAVRRKKVEYRINYIIIEKYLTMPNPNNEHTIYKHEDSNLDPNSTKLEAVVGYDIVYYLFISYSSGYHY